MKKKHSKWLVAMVLAVFAAVALTGCGSGQDAADSGSSAAESEAPALQPADVAGNYLVVSMEGEETLSTEDLELMKEMGLTVGLELRSDGTGEMDLFGQPLELSFDTVGMTIEMEGQEVPFTYENGTITLKQSTGDMVFERASGSESSDS